MLALGPLLVLVLVGLALYLAARSSRPEHPAGVLPQPAPRDAMSQQLRTWAAAGLLTPDQADAISSYEAARTRRAPVAAPADSHPRRAGRVPVAAEALGYLGGVLAVVGLVLVVAHYWTDMATWTRLALSGVAALALFAGGSLVREDADPALARLRWVSWLASTTSTGLLAGVIVDALGAKSPKAVALGSAGAVALVSAALWQWRERPVQQLTCVAGAVVFGGLVAAQSARVGRSASPSGRSARSCCCWACAGVPRSRCSPKRSALPRS